MRTVFILADSFNRRFMKAYGAEEVMFTPNLDRLAEKSVVFDNHWCGSAPCMPARRDLMTGRLNFMERPWGGIEPFDITLTSLLRTKNVYTHMETDHFHYVESGGENYFCDFTSWNIYRGVEHDTVNWGPDKTGIPAPSMPENFVGLYSPSYDVTKKLYNEKPERYSTPRTYNAAAEWLEKNKDADNFFLWVEGFDPHEPFDVPEEYINLYGKDAYDNPDNTYWPKYETADHYTQEQIQHFRKRYKALATMTDFYIGKLLEVLDRYNMWEDTAVIFTTDHGFMLGEHGFMAKCVMPDYNEVFHIPLMVHMPGIEPGRCNALTQNIDIFPTILECFAVDMSLCKNKLHGKSLLPLLRGETEVIHDKLLFGIFAKTINVTDGRYVYMRKAANEVNQPLYIYGAMMSILNKYIGYDTMDPKDFDRIEMGRYLSWVNYPVYKVPADAVYWGNYCLEFSLVNNYVPENLLFDIRQDYAQDYPCRDAELESKMIGLLMDAMEEYDSPEEQYVRLGLRST